MQIRLQIGWPLDSIPNIKGFRFRGITEDGDLIRCVVMLGSDGMHYAARESDGERIYHELRGWCQWLPPPPEKG
jgi:hypothetical protein